MVAAKLGDYEGRGEYALQRVYRLFSKSTITDCGSYQRASIVVPACVRNSDKLIEGGVYIFVVKGEVEVPKTQDTPKSWVFTLDKCGSWYPLDHATHYAELQTLVGTAKSCKPI